MLSIILGMAAATSLSQILSYIEFLFSEWRIDLKKTTIFEISVLKDFFAINSGVDFIY